ncbi:MAG: hypothetical protein KKF24_06775 [Gammaproteobacteria bacterium]|nr:hypothetical protein [Gammaproteobacteria bacterium]MBU1832384.1 hypothetical protein [Gammaproteobacteria bacterium]
MKKTEYTHGEAIGLGVPIELGLGWAEHGTPFAHLFPQSSSIIHLNERWIVYDIKDIGCVVRNKFATELADICNRFLRTYFPEADVTVSVKNLIAVHSKIQRNQRTALFLNCNEISKDLTKKLSCIAEFVCARVQQLQPDLLYLNDSTRLLEPEEMDFLKGQIDDFRKHMSGKKITHPFGMETLGENPTITGFSGEFDTYEYELPPAEEVRGLASIDGFRESRNSVYLIINSDDGDGNVFKIFVIHDTKLIRLITEAKYYDKKIHYIADKIFEKLPDKPTFILKDIEILD